MLVSSESITESNITVEGLLEFDVPRGLKSSKLSSSLLFEVAEIEEYLSAALFTDPFDAPVAGES